MGEEHDRKLDYIVDENAASFGKLRDLTEDLVAVVEHEKRIIDEAPPEAPIAKRSSASRSRRRNR